MSEGKIYQLPCDRKFRITCKECYVSESSTGYSQVFHCAFHPSQPILACGLSNGVIQIFRGSSANAAFSEWEQDIQCHVDVNSHIHRLAWSLNGKHLVAGCFDGTLALWRLQNSDAERVFQIKVHQLAIFDVTWNQWNQNLFATRSRDEGEIQTVVLWNLRRDDSDFLQPFHLTSKFVSDLVWISSTRLAICTFEGAIFVYNAEKKVAVKRLYHAGVCLLRWHFSLHYLVSCSNDGSIKIWSKKRYSDIDEIQLNSRIYCIDCHGIRSGGTSALIASGLEDGSVVIWHVTQNRWETLEGHPDAVTRVSFSPDGSFLATLDTEEKLIIWSTKNWTRVFEHAKQTNLDWDHLKWSCTGNKLAISSQNIHIVELMESGAGSDSDENCL